jgi:hypothetical protein
MSVSRVRIPLFALAIGVACSAKELPPKGEVVVVLTTDLNPPKDFDVAHVRVTEVDDAGNDGKELLDADYSFPSSVTLPATLGIIGGPDPNVRVHVRVVVRQLGKVILLRDVRTSIPQDRIAALPIGIQWLCEGDQFVVESAQGPQSKCEKDKTCIAGACQPIDVDPSTLPNYDPGALGGVAGNDQCFDTLSCFSGEGVKVVTPTPDCLVDATSINRPNVAIELTPPQAGVCTPDVCLVPLDEDPLIGWIREGTSLRLPDQVCKRGLTVLLSTKCDSKTSLVPPCGALSGTQGADASALDATIPRPDASSDAPPGDGPISDGPESDAPLDGGVCSPASPPCFDANTTGMCSGDTVVAAAACTGDAGPTSTFFCVAGTCQDRDWPPGPLPPDSPSGFVTDASTVTDPATGLVWMRNLPAGLFNLQDAKDFCKTHGPANHWRLPTYKELLSIVDFSRVADTTKPAVDTNAFPSIGSSGYWTTTEDAEFSPSKYTVRFVNFVTVANGGTDYAVICVREKGTP